MGRRVRIQHVRYRQGCCVWASGWCCGQEPGGRFLMSNQGKRGWKNVYKDLTEKILNGRQVNKISQLLFFSPKTVLFPLLMKKSFYNFLNTSVPYWEKFIYFSKIFSPGMFACRLSLNALSCNISRIFTSRPALRLISQYPHTFNISWKSISRPALRLISQYPLTSNISRKLISRPSLRLISQYLLTFNISRKLISRPALRLISRSSLIS